MKFDPEVARKAKEELAIKIEQIAMKYAAEIGVNSIFRSRNRCQFAL